ncbi:MAG: hypothetical protein QG630_457 [Patescibacteria group bacterium]|nr:hypothetical protein [Patescibacteria group bacterium]
MTKNKKIVFSMDLMEIKYIGKERKKNILYTAYGATKQEALSSICCFMIANLNESELVNKKYFISSKVLVTKFPLNKILTKMQNLNKF